jgi:hypothetical protein
MFECLPAGQSSHTPANAPFPVSQFSQTFLLVPLPLVHIVHAADPCVEICPDGQGLQVVPDANAWYFPGLQSLQDVFLT